MEPTTGRSGLSLNAGLIRRILVDFLRDAFRTSGFGTGVIGLSGGIDSSLVACLAAEAIGPANVVGVLMPYTTSSPDSVEDGELIVHQLGIRSAVIPITQMVDAHFDRMGDGGNLRRGNIMARERMIVLYDISSAEQGLVLGTSNKTEIMLGYGTLFGDTASAINPIGDLYKTQVRQLAAEMGVPERIITKAPSADLWTGQSDEAELGFSYEEVDRLLLCMVDERNGEEELRGLGFDPGFIRRVQGLIRKNHFKRRPPVVAKISNRTTNLDFRYPRDWGV